MVHRAHSALLAACFLLLAVRVSAEPTAAPTPLYKAPPGAKIATSTSGLQYIDLIVGQGELPKAGDVCIVHYTAWLEDGTEVDTSTKPRVQPNDPTKTLKILPFGFKLGSGQVIRGWDEGVATMREGGTRLMFMPPSLAYGSTGAGSAIPPDARMTFRVELLKIKREPVPPMKPEP